MIHLLRMGAAAMQGALMRREPGPDPQPFDPADIPGLEAWYRGDSYAGGVAMDRSGNGRDAAAIGTVNSVVSNGHIAFEFGGVGRLAASFEAVLPQPHTVYLVFEPTDLSHDSYWHDGVDSTNRVGLRTVEDGYFFFAPNALTGGTVLAEPHASAFVVNGPLTAGYVDDFAAPLVSGNGSNSLVGLTLGGSHSGAARAKGFVWECLLYSGAHDAESRAKIAGYFNARYGLNITT